MRALCLAALAVLAAASTASAQFNAFYSGTQYVDGKSYPATARFSVEKGRVAMFMTGQDSVRMLFLEKEGVLRVIDLGRKSSFDLTADRMNQMRGVADDASKMMESQLASMPEEQRKMLEAQMARMPGHGGKEAKAAPIDYVWTKQTQKIKGYESTKVECMSAGVKKSEYWGTTSSDLKLKDDDRATVLKMQDYLRNFSIHVTDGGGAGGSRAFQWDTKVDGYPLITRCFTGDDTTLDLHLDSFDRKALSADLFETPEGVTQQSMPDLGGLSQGGGRGEHARKKH